jgi:putative PEP-CTERM system TPR-repeat lipoprotein
MNKQWLSMKTSPRFGLVSAVVLAAALAACGGGGGKQEADLQTAVNEAVAKGDINSALIRLKSHLAEQPKSAQARFLMGSTLAAAGDWRTSELELRKALDLKYSPDQVLPLLARVLLTQAQPKKVTEEFAKRFLDDKRANADLRTSVGLAFLRLGDRKAAEVAVAEALASDPKFPAARLAQARFLAVDGDYAKSLALIDEVIAADGGQAETWQAKGEVLQLGTKELDKALQAYAKAQAAKPDYAQAYFSSIEIMLAKRDVEGTKKQFEALKKVAPQRLQTRFIEAQLAYLDQDYPRARTLLQALLEVVPDYFPVLLLDGAVKMQLNANLQAEASLGKAAHLIPGAALAKKMLAQTHLRMGQFNNALADLASLVETDHNDPVTLSLVAEAYLQSGNLNKADEYYTRAAKANPNDVSVRTAMALARLAKGDSEGAFGELYSAASGDKSDVVDLAIISAHQRRGEFDKALKAINVLEAKIPGKALTSDLAGRNYLAQNDKATARKHFERANEIAPLYFPAVLSLAKLDVLDKNNDAARKRFEALLKLNPRHSDAKMALIDLRITEKTPKQEVAKLLADLIASDTAFAPARLKLIELHLANQAPKQAVTVAQEAVTSSPNNTDFLDALGRAQLAASETQQAISTFNKLGSLMPNQIGPMLRLADAYVSQSDSNGAMNALRRGLEISPGNVEINRRLMALSMAAKKPEAAITAAKAMQKRKPAEVAGYVFEAEIHATRKDWPAAAAVLKQAMVSAPTQARPAALKYYLSLVSMDKRAEADQSVTAWMKDHPKDGKFLSDVGEALIVRNDLPTAERYLLAALKLVPDSAGINNNLAWLMVKQQKKGGLAYAKRAVEISPSMPAILDTYALALADDGQFDKAVEASQQAITKAPNDLGLKLTLAGIYVKAKKNDLARAELEKLVAPGVKFSGQEEARQLLASIKGK